MSEVLKKYRNGDYDFTIYSDGTLVRETDIENPKVVYPTSIDIKITDHCTMNCFWCHESSTPKGLHGDLTKLLEVIKDLPAGGEVALGGGNPLDHIGLVPFLYEIKKRGLYANLTVNQGHLKEFNALLTFLIKEDLIKGLGISVSNNNFKHIKPLLKLTDNIVYHVIAGVNKVEIMDKLIALGKSKVLVLGYKKFGFGIKYHNEEIDKEIKRWYMYLPKYIGKCIISFDNLAIEQLNVKRLFTDAGWNKFYMGDDFVFTMYIDAVKQQFAPTSRSTNRKSFKEYSSVVEYFNKERENCNQKQEVNV